MTTYTAYWMMDRLGNHSTPFKFQINASSYNDARNEAIKILQEKIVHYQASITLLGVKED
jgi:hypothetical protein